MMKKNLHNYGFFCLMIIVVFTFSCEKEVQLVEREAPTKLAVICNFSPDEPFHLQLSKTQSIFSGSNSENLVNNAEVQICVGNELIEKVPHINPNNTDGKDKYQSMVSAKTQEVYTLKIDIEGMDPITATSAIPTAVNITHTSIGEVTKFERGNSSEPMEYKVRLAVSLDDPFEKNYYQINFYQELYSINQSLGQDSVIHQTSNYSYAQIDNDLAYNFNLLDAGVLFKDVVFNGNSQEFVFEPIFYFDSNSYKPVNIIMELRTVSEEYYQFYTSVYRQNQQFNPQDELQVGIPPFTDPATVFSNIKNGYGIFAGYSKVQKKSPIEF